MPKVKFEIVKIASLYNSLSSCSSCGAPKRDEEECQRVRQKLIEVLGNANVESPQIVTMTLEIMGCNNFGRYPHETIDYGD